MRRQLTLRPIRFLATLANTQLVVSTTAVGIPSTWIPSGASGGWIACDTLGGGVKMALGTTAPTTAWGIDLGPGDIFEVRDSVELVEQMQFVRVTSADGRISFVPFTE